MVVTIEKHYHQGHQGLCAVCEAPTVLCPPSPFAPGSYWRCKACIDAKRVSYDDLVMAGTGKEMYREFGKEYFTSRRKPTLQFLNISEDKYWGDVLHYAKLGRNTV